MSDRREELTRQGWPDYFETLTKETEGFDVTIEIVGPELGDQVEAEKLPLAYLAYDNKDDVSSSPSAVATAATRSCAT